MTVRPRKPRTASAPRTPDPEPEMSREEEQLVLQLIASAMGLPRICVYRACRRRKRCVGPAATCAAHHRGLVRRRLPAAIKLIAVPEGTSGGR